MVLWQRHRAPDAGRHGAMLEALSGLATWLTHTRIATAYDPSNGCIDTGAPARAWRVIMPLAARAVTLCLIKHPGLTHHRPETSVTASAVEKPAKTPVARATCRHDFDRQPMLARCLSVLPRDANRSTPPSTSPPEPRPTNQTKDGVLLEFISLLFALKLLPHAVVATATRQSYPPT
jgi:hypothetical protein